MSLKPLVLDTTGPVRKRRWSKQRDSWETNTHVPAVDATSFVLLDLISWVLTFVIGDGPSPLAMSPVEHQHEQKRAWEALPPQIRGNRNYYEEINTSPVPYGHVRIRLYQSIKYLPSTWPLLTAVIALEPSGALNVKKVKKLWGLENFSIADPYRMKLVLPDHDYLISPLTVLNLSQHYGAINIIEPSVSPSTKCLRYIRFHLYRPLAFYLSCQQDTCVTWLRQRTQIMDWSDETQRDLQGTLRYGARRLEGWTAENHPDLLWLWESISFSGLLTLVLIFLLWKFPSELYDSY